MLSYICQNKQDKNYEKQHIFQLVGICNMLIRFKFNFFSYYIMENKLIEFIEEVQKVFPNIDEDVLTDYFTYGYTADEFIYRETELQNEDAEMDEQYKKDRASWI